MEESIKNLIDDLIQQGYERKNILWSFTNLINSDNLTSDDDSDEYQYVSKKPGIPFRDYQFDSDDDDSSYEPESSDDSDEPDKLPTLREDEPVDLPDGDCEHDPNITKEELDRDLENYMNHEDSCKCYENVCPICLEGLCEYKVECCDNLFHYKCIMKLFHHDRAECPLCRADIYFDKGDLIYIKRSASPEFTRQMLEPPKVPDCFARENTEPKELLVNPVEGMENMYVEIQHGFVVTFNNGTVTVLGKTIGGYNNMVELNEMDKDLARSLGLFCE